MTSRKLLLTESQLRLVIRKNLFENGLFDDILMEAHGLLMEWGDSFWETYQTFKIIFSILGLVLGAVVLLVAIASVTTATGGTAAVGIVAAIQTAATSLGIAPTVLGIINFVMALADHKKNKITGEWESKPQWFDAFMGFLGMFGGIIQGLGNLTGQALKFFKTLSDLAITSDKFAKLIKGFDMTGLSWDIIGPIYDALLGEGFNRRSNKKLFEAQMGDEKIDKPSIDVGEKSNDVAKKSNKVDWKRIKEEFEKDAEILSMINVTNNLKAKYEEFRKMDKKGKAAIQKGDFVNGFLKPFVQDLKNK